MPTRGQMDNWGLRYIDIQILRWGDPQASYDTLRPRSGYRHVARMLTELRPELNGITTVAPAPTMETQPRVMAATPVAPVAASSVTLQPFLAGPGN
jgi:hypothetical protein